MLAHKKKIAWGIGDGRSRTLLLCSTVSSQCGAALVVWYAVRVAGQLAIMGSVRARRCTSQARWQCDNAVSLGSKSAVQIDATTIYKDKIQNNI